MNWSADWYSTWTACDNPLVFPHNGLVAVPQSHNDLIININFSVIDKMLKS